MWDVALWHVKPGQDLNGTDLESVADQIDLGVEVHGSLKVVIPVDSVVKVFGTPAFIRMDIQCKVLDIMMQLYVIGVTTLGVLCAVLITQL